MQKFLPLDLAAGEHYCSKCKKRTMWGGTTQQRCEGCGKPFPCFYADCAHQDCQAYRKATLFEGPGESSDPKDSMEAEKFMEFLKS